ncbi:hypothetical protein K474DRAFT_1772593 [Panus rudis PR-1116 ss-1]|nr:hypothetical protein K474DRAFT_1772593 [Panus rudis PR-1116 ss-1]
MTSALLAAPLHRGISALPVELLVAIFDNYVAESSSEIYRPEDTLYHAKLKGQLLFLLCRVCRRWSDIVRGRSAYWTTISTGQTLPGLFAAITHSGWLPLTAAIVWTDSIESDNFLEKQRTKALMILDELPRIRKLDFHVPLPIIKEIRDYFDEQLIPAPNLEELSLKNTEDWRCKEKFPDLLSFLYESPNLRKLEILDMSIRTAQRFFRPNLRSLVIDAHNPSVTVYDLLDIVAEMPLLVELRLRRILRMDEVSYTDDPELVQLPFLEDLELNDSLPECCEFLAHISHPSKTRLSIISAGKDDASVFDRIRTITLMANSKKHYTDDLSFVLSSLSITVGSTRHLVHYNGWPTVIPAEQTIPGPVENAPKNTPTLHLQDWCSSGESYLIIGAFKNSWSTAHLQSIAIHGAVAHDWAEFSSEIVEIFSECHQLRELHALEWTMDHMKKLLSPTYAVLFPSLESLSATHLLWNPDRRLQLSQILQARRESGSAIRHLKLTECVDAFEEDVRLALSLVEQSEWDGVQKSRNDLPRSAYTGIGTGEDEPGTGYYLPPTLEEYEEEFGYSSDEDEAILDSFHPRLDGPFFDDIDGIADYLPARHQRLI